MIPAVVRMEAAHLSDVAELETLCFSSPWSETALSLLLGEEAVGFCVCAGEKDGKKAGKVIAYGGMLYAVDEGQILNIATHPDWRRQGLAAAVLSTLEAHARKKGLCRLSLEVRASGAPAISLYTKQGFYEAGRRKGFYRAPREDALIMIKDLV